MSIGAAEAGDYFAEALSVLGDKLIEPRSLQHAGEYAFTDPDEPNEPVRQFKENAEFDKLPLESISADWSALKMPEMPRSQPEPT